MKVKVTSRISILRAFTFLSISGDDEIDIDEYTTVWNQSYGIPVEECREAFHKISDVSRLPLDDFFFQSFRDLQGLSEKEVPFFSNRNRQNRKNKGM